MVHHVVVSGATTLKYWALHATERPARCKFYSIRIVLRAGHAASHACHAPPYCSLGRAFRAFERDTNTTTERASTTAHNDKELWNISPYTLNALQDRAPQDRNLADTVDLHYSVDIALRLSTGACKESARRGGRIEHSAAGAGE